MPDRTTKVTLLANVSGYLAGMEAAAIKTRQLGTASERLAAQRQGFDMLGRSMLAVGALAAAAVGIAIKEFAEFDAKMSQVQSLSHATADEMNALSTAALHMGQAIGFSANEVADAEIELVKAGISVSDIMGGALAGSLQLAAAGQIDVAEATEIATIAMTQFGLKGQDITHVADLFSAGADKALGGVGDLGEALKSGGLVASQFGVSLEETTGTLSAFANAGLIGEVAGTDLRQMLLKLAAPAADAEAAMKTYGISIYDTSGKFVGISNLAGQLHDKLGGLTDSTRNATLATIFGARAIAGANVLYKEGAVGISTWTGTVDDSGFAAQQAAGKMDNLQGDVKKLGAAFNTDLIESGSTANDALRGITQTLTGVLEIAGELPENVQGAGLALTGITAAVSLVGGTALIAVPKLAAFRASLVTLETTAVAASAPFIAVTAAIASLVYILSGYVTAAADAKTASDGYLESLNQTTGAITKYTSASVAKELQDKGAFDLAKRAGVSQKELTEAVTEGGDKLLAVSQKISEASDLTLVWDDSTKTLRTSQQMLQLEIFGTHKEIQDAQGSWKELDDATSTAADSTEGAAEAYKDAAEQASSLDSELNDLIATINKANGVGQDAVTTNASYQQALADVNDTIAKAKAGVEGYSLGIDEHTAAGSKNVAMLADLAKKNEDAAKAQFDLDGSTTNYVANLTAGHDAIVKQAEALGATADQAEDIAEKIASIPTDAEIKILINDSNANRQLDAVVARLINLQDRHFTAFVDVQGGHQNGGAYVNGVQRFEDGGYIGSGTYAGRAGGIRMFAEANVPWETYISGKPGQEARNTQLALGALSRLGHTPQPVHYAPAGGAPTTIINKSLTVNAPVQAGLVSNSSQLSQDITKVITDGIKDGSIDPGWND